MHGESDFIEENFKHVIDIKYICSKTLQDGNNSITEKKEEYRSAGRNFAKTFYRSSRTGQELKIIYRKYFNKKGRNFEHTNHS